MEREEVDLRMAAEGTNNLAEIHKRGRASTGIIIKVVEYEVNNYAGIVAVVIDTSRIEFLSFLIFHCVSTHSLLNFICWFNTHV